MGYWDAVFLLDTTSAIALIEEADRPELVGILAGQAQRVEVPSTVANEIRDPETLKSLVESEDVEVIDSWPGEVYDDLFDRFPKLGSGELGVLARGIGLKRDDRAFRCVLDDGLAREVAERHGLDTTGTIGVLLEMEQRGGLDREEHLDILDALEEEGFRYPWETHPLLS